MAKMKYEIITDMKLPDGYCGSYRYGKPEGVCLHEPANTGLIQNQIGYQLRDPAANGIVHAWADDDELREISNTDYKCWGAGGIANARLAQIECCRFDDRARAVASIDRGLFWAAYQLFYYKLPCTDATQNGNGTVWTHAAVTKFLGNTDHVDPLPYWNSVGVTWSAAYAQIQKYFYALQAGDSTVVPALGTSAAAPVQVVAAPAAVVRNPVAYDATIIEGGYSIDSKPWGEPNFATWGSTTDLVGKVFNFYEEDGRREYANGVGLGWVDKRAIKKVPVVVESILYLPNGQNWVVYKENGPYEVGHVISVQGKEGSWFTILGEKGPNLLVIDLPSEGRVSIYFDKDKGASISHKYA